jgi:hypothetical protein
MINHEMLCWASAAGGLNVRFVHAQKF